ncbi:MAG: hypothetical protein MUC36_26775 [Planctomycetes bacterium]|jgi:hypothetical protein|nr:hypothetical protein [Planctomycetota bacterium]
MRLIAISASLALAVSAAAQEPEFHGQKPTAAFESFRRLHGGDWVAQWNPATGTPNAVYGTGLQLADWRENTLVEARRHALMQLEQHRELLGTGTSTFQENTGARMGRTWSFVFDQFFAGLPVIDGRADVRINMKGVVAMLGSRAVQIPADFDTAPALAQEVAEAAAWVAVGSDKNKVPQPGAQRAPRLVIWADAEAKVIATPHLAWEIPISNVDAQGQGPVGRYYIDAKTGAVLQYRSDKHDCGFASCTGAAAHVPPIAPSALAMPPIPTTVTLQSWTRTGNDAFSALTNVPLPGVVLSVPGVGNVTTDANGEFTIDITAPVTITIGQLDGRHHGVISGAAAPTGSFLVNPGVATTMQLSSAAASTDEAAHPTTSYWVDKTNEFCRSILGNTAQLATASNIAVTVNIASTCNAYYTGNSINFYSAGGSCSNTAFSTVVAHEWGHGIDDRYGGISNTNAEGMSEGLGDIIGLYLVDSPILGSGFQTTGVGIRNGNNTFVYPYSTTSPHGAGQVWMGFAWRLRENLRAALGTPQAIAISNDIVIGTVVASPTTRVDGVREVFIADDDDGNLLNGTPHYAQLSAAAITKGIPYPELQLVSISHTALGNTPNQLAPRRVDCTAAVVSGGTINQLRLHYNAGAGNVVRNMKPNGNTNGFTAMLPGQISGSVTYHFEALHSSGTVVRLPQTGEYTYLTTVTTSGPFTGFYLENFDASAGGWTSGLISGTINDWQRGAPNGKFGTQSGVPWSDPSAAASTGAVFGTDLGAGTSNGRYPGSTNYWLRSPAINCTGRFGTFLRFKRWLTVEEALYDQATIFVNGVQVWQNPQSGNLLDTAWQNVEYAIPMADNNASVVIEFRLTTDSALSLGGWNIDNVELGTKTIAQLPAELRMLPEQAAQGTTMNLDVRTPSNSRPFILVLGDTAGPTPIPGFPTLLVGGASIAGFPANTDAAGLYTSSFTAPNIPSTIGEFYYSQVLTLDAAFTTFVVSNPHINLFTQTP